MSLSATHRQPWDVWRPFTPRLARVDLSGLIFVVLALAWAGYLIPRALRQHDDLESYAPVDTSSDTARVLRRTPAMMRLLLADTPPVDPERREADRVALKDSERERREALTRSRPPSRGAAVRRRRILLALVLLTAVVTGAASLSYLPWWGVAVPGGLVAGWLVLCVLMARTSRLAARRGMRFEVAKTLAADDEVPSQGAVPAVPASPIVQGLVAEVHQDADHVAEPALDSETGALWDPLPLQLPTYVGKATARRTVRTIELTQGVTSSGHDAADSALARQAAEADRSSQQGSAEATSDSSAPARRAAGA